MRATTALAALHHAIPSLAAAASVRQAKEPEIATFSPTAV